MENGEVIQGGLQEKCKAYMMRMPKCQSMKMLQIRKNFKKDNASFIQE